MLCELLHFSVQVLTKCFCHIVCVHSAGSSRVCAKLFLGPGLVSDLAQNEAD